MKAAKRKKSSGRKKMVWHIRDFRELFELPDDLRKKRIGPLSYTKSFVSLTGKSEAHEIEHCERLAELKSHKERHLLRSVFEDLKNFSGKKAPTHRGYLMTTAEQPASFDYLASQLKVKVCDLKKAVPELARIGLIERVSMNGFTDGTRPKKVKRSARKNGKSEHSGTVRKSPDYSGERRKTFKKRKRSERKLNKRNGKGKYKGAKKRQKSRVIDNPHALDEKAKRKEKPATSETPVTVQPLPTKPQNPQKGGHRVVQFTAPSALKNTELLGDVAKGILHRYSPDSKKFGGEIYLALKLPWDPNSEMGRRELGCFASLWQGVGDMPMREELRERAICEARKIAKRRQNRKRGAVWCTVFKNLVAAYNQRVG